MALFALAAFSPVVLILIACFAGGLWAWLAIGYVTILAFFLDRLMPEEIQNADPQAEFPASTPLLVVLAFGHLAILAAVIWAVAGPTGLTLTDRILTAMAAAFFIGQVSHPVGHELIHKSSKALHRLGKLVYVSILFGHHASAHLKVHHIYVGSNDDPNSARLGEGFYSFALRAWPGGFNAGLRAENRVHSGRPAWRHAYVFYGLGAGAMVALAWQIGGLAGVVTFLCLSLYAQLQILMSDYVQHYGLPRHRLADGKLEPVGPQHAWNAPHWFTSAMLLNAPRHSDHHVRPDRAYPALQLDEDAMPCLPFSLPVMAGIALVPPLWRRVMDPRCALWRPVWIDTPKADARNIPPAILQHAKSSGAPAGILPVSNHAFDRDTLQSDGRDDGGTRRPSDDGSGV